MYRIYPSYRAERDDLQTDISSSKAIVARKRKSLEKINEQIRHILSDYETSIKGSEVPKTNEELLKENRLTKSQLSTVQLNNTHLQERLSEAEKELREVKAKVACFTYHPSNDVWNMDVEELKKEKKSLYEEEMTLHRSINKATQRWDHLTHVGPTEDDIIDHDPSVDIVSVYHRINDLKEDIISVLEDEWWERHKGHGIYKYDLLAHPYIPRIIEADSKLMETITKASVDSVKSFYDNPNQSLSASLNPNDYSKVKLGADCVRNSSNTGSIVRVYLKDPYFDSQINEVEFEDPRILDEELVTALSSKGLDRRGHPASYSSSCSVM